MNRPRHSTVNLRQWIEVEYRYREAMEDGVIDAQEGAHIIEGFEGGRAIAAVLVAGDALAQAAARSSDPEYIGNLASIYLVRAEALPEKQTA